jgi:hypothetical protein
MSKLARKRQNATGTQQGLEPVEHRGRVTIGRKRRAGLAAAAIAAGTVLAAVPFSGAMRADAAATWNQGSGPMIEMLSAAQNDVRCANLSATQLVSLMVAPTYYESGNSTTAAPSPMAHGRGDNQSSLYQSSGSTGNFWHPGIGLWQMDSAGVGRPWASYQRIDTAVAAAPVAREIASNYCGTINASNSNQAAARRAAWGCNPSNTVCNVWFGCENLQCENVYNDVFVPGPDGGSYSVSKDSSIGARGGLELRQCRIGLSTSTQNCWFINEDAAQGNTSSWNRSAPGNPDVESYYSWRTLSNEWREQWSTLHPNSTHQLRSFQDNARGNITWTSGKSLCDVTSGPPGIGHCS